jgi:nucleotide-binding universal stress UspA family protein
VDNVRRAQEAEGMSTDRLLNDLPEADVEPAPPAALVVGHDGSEYATAALATALQLASDLGAPVTVVRAWSMVTAPRPAGWTFGTVPSTDELAAAVTAELEDDVRRSSVSSPTSSSPATPTTPAPSAA